MNFLRAFALLTFLMYTSILTAQLKNNSHLIPASKALYEDYLNKYESSGSLMHNRLLKKVTDDLKNATIRYLNDTGRNETLNEFSWACKIVKGDGKEQNLLVMPGGKILFFSEMFSLANNESKIAWFISHGLAHTLIDEGDINTVQNFGILGEDGQEFTNFEELLADQLGAKIMAIAGYDPRVGVDIWNEKENMEEEDLEYFHYHPSYEDKIMSLENFATDAIKEARKYGTTSFK